MVVSERNSDPAVSSPLVLMMIAELPRKSVTLALGGSMYHRLVHHSEHDTRPA
jgi:hypothetical protein